ncbi:MAG: chromosomal replication initiator protein DnaA [Candidatus Saccharimonadales bacterium]
MQKSDLWQAVLGEIELTVSRGSFVTWFKNTYLLDISDDLVVIGAPNVFIKHQLERKFNDIIAATLLKNGVKTSEISYKIHSVPVAPSQTEDEPALFITETSSANQPKQRASSLTHNYRQALNRRYTFDNFVVGSGNELAYAACQGVAAHPGSKYNPLFIYGGVGIGKTHLVQATGNAVLAAKPKTKVVCVSTEQFVQEFVDALKFKKNTDFADFYRSADVLIVDDIQFLAGKEKIQEEFFHTFNALHQASKQIIISSDKPPSDIPTLEERLKSRFVSGMTIDMQNPDLETRCAIIQTKALVHGVDLPTDVTEHLAANVQTNIRELEGALNHLLASCEMRSLEPTIDIARVLIGTKSRPKHLTAHQIVERTARHFQITLDEITGAKRDKDIVVPRQIAMYIMRSELHTSFPKIARELGRKDHTTAIHSVEKIAKEASFNGDIKNAINQIRERLYV